MTPRRGFTNPKHTHKLNSIGFYVQPVVLTNSNKNKDRECIKQNRTWAVLICELVYSGNNINILTLVQQLHTQEGLLMKEE